MQLLDGDVAEAAGAVDGEAISDEGKSASTAVAAGQPGSNRSPV
jgi:hypothetical protein